MGSKEETPTKDLQKQVWLMKESRSKPGNFYYYNTVTKQTSWKKPDPLPEVVERNVPVPALPSGSNYTSTSTDLVRNRKKSAVEPDHSKTVGSEHRVKKKKKRKRSKVPQIVSDPIKQTCAGNTYLARNALEAKKRISAGEKNLTSGTFTTCNFKEVSCDKNASATSTLTNVKVETDKIIHTKDVDLPQEIKDPPKKNLVKEEVPHKVSLSKASKTRAELPLLTAGKESNHKVKSPTALFEGICETPKAAGKITTTADTPLTCSAQRRLKRLQSKLAVERKEKEKTIVKTPKRNVPPAHKNAASQDNFVSLSEKENSLEAIQDVAFRESRVLHRAESSGPAAGVETGASVPSSEAKFEEMEIEYTEQDILLNIEELRKESVTADMEYQTTFMDVDMNVDVPRKEVSDILHVVLDTNILLSHLVFVQGLRDTASLEGKSITLFIPWQVLHELDRLKELGKTSIRPLARDAIKFLHQCFMSRHPRVRGQKHEDAMNKKFECPDDSILYACSQLKQQQYDVVLLTNDFNLCNKALVSEIKAVTKEQLMADMTQNVKQNATIGTGLSVNRGQASKRLSRTVGTSEASGPTEAAQSDSILSDLIIVIKQLLSEVVAQGMEREYGVLWKKRTVIPPPWEAEQVIVCLSKHWLPICGTFIPANIKLHADELLQFFKVKSKKYGLLLHEIEGAIQNTLEICKACSDTYTDVISAVVMQLEDLKLKCKTPAGTSKDISQDPDTSTAVACSSHDLSNDLSNNSPDRCTLVLMCFERVYNTANNFCIGLQSVSTKDPEWKYRAEHMLRAVRLLLQQFNILLSKSKHEFNAQDTTIKTLLHLIKEDSFINEEDIVNFLSHDNSRVLLENGLRQFTSFEEILARVCS